MTANSTPESFDAVLAEVYALPKASQCKALADRLQSAHARELAEQQATHAAEVGKYKVAWEEFSERTEWVQQTAKPKELGLHRADVLRLRIEQAEARADAAMGLLNTAVDVIEEGLSDRQSYDFRARAESCARSIKQALAGGERKDG